MSHIRGCGFILVSKQLIVENISYKLSFVDDFLMSKLRRLSGRDRLGRGGFSDWSLCHRLQLTGSPLHAH